MGFEEFFIQNSAIIITSVVTIGSVFLGIWVGVLISDRKENRRKKEELDKIHFLLNADFTYISRIANSGINHHNDWQEFIKKDDWFAENLSVTNTKLVDFLTELHHKISGFTYWDSLISSGSMIKLEADELRIITVSHNAIVEILNITAASHKRLADKIIKYATTTDMTTEQKIQAVQHECNIYLNGLVETYNDIKYHIQKVQNVVKWVDLKAEPITLTEKKYHVPTGYKENPVP